MVFASWRGVVGVVKPTHRPGSLEEFIRLLPEGIGVVPVYLNFKRGTEDEFRAALNAVEEKVAEAKMIVEHGRAVHRAWCARIFGARLPEEDGARETRLDAVVAATDLYLWKLLRRDLGRSLNEAKQVMRTLVEGVLDRSPPPGRE
jgi:hypothetical protein